MTDPVVISIITGVVAIIVAAISAYFAYKSKNVSQETHNLVNSRMDEFMEMAKKSFKAEGVLQEKTDEAARKKAVR